MIVKGGLVVRAGKTKRGRQTRARIVYAAARLFGDRGYLETTMAAIAAEAGVAAQTLYLAFGSKVAILEAANDVAVVGDDEPIALLDRPWMADLRAELDGLRALELTMTNTLQVIERTSPLYGVIQSAAADPEVAELLTRTKAQRLSALRTLAEELTAKAGFSAELSADRAADILYAVVSNELYQVLVVERHWSAEDWKTWAYDSAALRLFPKSTPSKRGKRPLPRHPTVTHEEAATAIRHARNPRKLLPTVIRKRRST